MALGQKMRTTLDIEDDVLLAVREIAQRRGMSMGQVVSDLARQALTEEPTGSTRDGVPLFPVRNDRGIICLELVNRLRDEAD
jgi:hypothetical protein